MTTDQTARSAASARPIRVALDARIPADQWGGIQHAVQGLVSGLAGLPIDDDVVVVGNADAARWLAPYLMPRIRLIVADAGTGRSAPRRVYDAFTARSPTLANGTAALIARVAPWSLRPPRSDGLLERLDVDLVHFLTPGAMLTSIPSIYQPHDLQHVHLPEFFGRARRQYRDASYRAFADQATFVASMTQWGRDDIVASFGLPPQKVAVVPWAPIAGRLRQESHAGLPALPDRYSFYPAQTWPHKNHLRLLNALALLRKRGVRVPLVSTGRQNEHYATIRAEIARLDLADQVTFLGYVDDATLDAVFRGARMLVFPSLFEGWGIPLVEAFAYGVPVASSNASALPEVAAGAAVLFDPHRPEAIADAIEQVWTNETLRESLREDGRLVASRLDWTRTAATFVALYKRVAGRRLSAEETKLLEPPTLVP